MLLTWRLQNMGLLFGGAIEWVQPQKLVGPIMYKG